MAARRQRDADVGAMRAAVDGQLQTAMDTGVTVNPALAEAVARRASGGSTSTATATASRRPPASSPASPDPPPLVFGTCRASDADPELVARCVALERRTMRGYRGDEASLLELFARSNTHLVRASCGDEVVGFCLHDEVRALKPQLVPDPRSR